jgi:xanthine phosphoribosyltransferase
MNKLIIDDVKFKGLVATICREIASDEWKPDYVVGLTRGGLLPAVMISHYLNVPMQSLDVGLRDGGSCVSNLGMAEDVFEGKKILIVDDINDQGSTVNWIKKDWSSGCFPRDPKWESIWGDNVRFAVLTHNQSSQFKDPDYYVWTVNKAEEDCWLVYPWEDFWL